jgi:hypothetical protein
MTHKALVRRLQISCLGLDPVDPLRLLVDDVIEALRENAMREVQRLGQEIEQEPVVGITAIRTWFKDGRVVTQTLCNSWVDTTPPQQGKEPVKYSDYEPDGVHHNKPEQEPVGYWKEHAQGLQRDYDSLLAEFQAQRTWERPWVSLTDEEENEYNYLGPDMHWVIQEIEAKLKEKNHG